MTTLFDPIRLGDLKLPNRIIMAPLTRSRAGASRIANPLMAEYYAQRASAGLIVTEATVVSPMGIGYAGTPGIWSPEQVEGWRFTTRAVHQAGGRIFLQLWHVGRISDPSFLDGALPVAPSAVAAKGNVNLLRPPTPFVTPRALARQEIPGIVESSEREPRMRSSPVLTVSNCMAPTATCWISSSRTAPICVPTTTAVRSRTARASCWKRWMRLFPFG